MFCNVYVRTKRVKTHWLYKIGFAQNKTYPEHNVIEYHNEKIYLLKYFLANLQIGNVLELEGISMRDFTLNLLVHRIDVRLVDGHAALGK